MEYGIQDIQSLKNKMLVVLISLGLIYALLYLLFTVLVPYNLTLRKQKDVFFRRVLFFTGLWTLFAANIYMIGDFIIGKWRPRMDSNDMQTIVSSLTSYVLVATLASLAAYILVFWLSARYLRSVFGYKPWTVFVSRGKKFGLF